MFFGSTDLSNISFVVSSTALKPRKPFPVYRAVGEGSSQVRDTAGPGGQRRGNRGCPDWIHSLGPDPGRFLRLCCRVPARGATDNFRARRRHKAGPARTDSVSSGRCLNIGTSEVFCDQYGTYSGKLLWAAQRS